MEKNEILYHGGIVEVKAPLVNVGRPDLDFGQGFYVTNNREQAEKWTVAKASRRKDQKAVVNVYHFDTEAFSSVKYAMKVFDEYNRDWLDFVADSRKGKSPWMNWDWIEGGIANDSVITTVDAYVDGFITSEQAIDRLVKEELHHQICIRNQEIIDRYLVFEKYEEI